MAYRRVSSESDESYATIDPEVIAAAVHHSSTMHTPEYSIPVSIEVSLSHVLQGIFEIDGLLTYADETLTIEYQPKEFIGRGSRVKTFDLPLDALREVSFKRRIAGSKLILHPVRLSTFENLPIAANAQIVLSVKRGDRKQAEALAAHIHRVLTFRAGPDSQDAIPFKGPDFGLREVKGHVYLENEEFLVFDVENALVGEFDTEKQLIKVAPQALLSVRLDERRVNDRLYIRPRSRDLLHAMPGSYKEELELKISRKHREKVEQLLYELTRLRKRPPSSSADEPDSSSSADEPNSI